ncbi:hypothetical protein BUALT_Bualt11G0046900 [Buddleja alternifolia]|uniref:Uncharacterized protein n=1 Tax=Buddleja alternifolia TaxID=168488 RepID=A0AAV6WSV4_9LAMI|nr:hypothetical protein BUALT_Bualt11G0046900 [Buddleja alternifolia]
MLSRSGFGFNSTTNMITVNSQEVWDNYIKTDSNARTMRFKSWPLYDDWVEIFGKDRATGEAVEGFADVVQQLLNKNVNNEQGKEMKRKAVFEAIGEVTSLDMEEMILVSHFIVIIRRTWIFFQSPERWKKNYGEDDFGRKVSWNGHYWSNKFFTLEVPVAVII